MKTATLTGAMLLAVLLLGAGWFVWSSRQAPAQPAPPSAGTVATAEKTEPAVDRADAVTPHFVDVTKAAGIDFSYFRGESGRWWTMEPTAGGVAFVDFDGDGWLDTFWVSGCQLPDDGKDRGHPHKLFRNNQDGTFGEVTPLAGDFLAGYGMGCQAGDFDNDGFADLYLTRFGRNDLFHNNGDGTFSTVTGAAGVASQSWWHSSSCFADLDGDGDLDLYVCTYVPFDPLTHEPCRRGGKADAPPEYCGPQLYPLGLPELLYRNDGDGTFTEIGDEAGVAGDLANSKSLGVVASDLDKDGKPDLFVANDLVNNFLFHNRGDMQFENIARHAAVASNSEGIDEASMGIACGDVNDDGYFDLLVTNFYLEHDTMYMNLGKSDELAFYDSTRVAGLALATRHTMGWGTAFVDYDLDGRLDLYVANGHLNPPGGDLDDPRYSMFAHLFRNVGGGRFKEVREQAGPFFQERWVTRGAATGDFDNDGRFDIAIVNHHKPVALARNETTTPNHVLGLVAVGRESNRDAINARVTVHLASTAAEPARALLREVFGGGSYVSALDRRLLIGLGQSTRVEQIEVRWPDGRVDSWDDMAADRQYLLIEGRAPRELRRYASFAARPRESAAHDTLSAPAWPDSEVANAGRGR